MKNINDPNISLNWDNLECLCKSCHEQEHEQDARNRYKSRKAWKAKQEKQASNKRRYIVNEKTGEIITLPHSEQK